MPIHPVILHCPRCRTQHVDKGRWATFDHKRHLCFGCGGLFEEPTAGVGVARLGEAPLD